MNKIIKCIIVDDEPAAHYVLTNYIKTQFPQLELVAQCYNGIEALNYLRENTVDLMFLDIDMPEITGLELLKMLTKPPKTILTTAYSEFALESYEYGVIDYLLKPIYFPRFLKAIDRLITSVSAQDVTKDLPGKTISIKVDGAQIEIELDKILYAQSFGNYVKLHTVKRNYLASITTNELEKMLPKSIFMRVHKSYIIALDHIKCFKKEIIKINDTIIPIGITYKRELFNILNSKVPN
ncbi:LytR/AlgR family response regulator transcription factor [Flavobacterium sp. '19STA2R22 D10 B1']|uniref:LytR/AlgR family response regulator transcription factor n=1 Tax=Flavobacterium aerium TaxID=3037261 RepID=UPI00278C802F|nr:LytTR family DNA-binding domain-containing protein [Flavobacterium sp. '19STA2R22 D10 B1']